MAKWVQLTPELAQQKFCFPAEVVEDPHNSIYILLEEEHISRYGPWSLMMVTKLDNSPEQIRLSFCEIDEDTVSIEGFDPSDFESGYFSLGRSAYRAFADALLNLSEKLPENKSGIQFRHLEKTELKYLRIERMQLEQCTQTFLLKLPQGNIGLEEMQDYTVLFFSVYKDAPRSVFFRSLAFSAKQLQEDEFAPDDEAICRIDLDRIGLRELAGLVLAHGELATEKA